MPLLDRGFNRFDGQLNASLYRNCLAPELDPSLRYSCDFEKVIKQPRELLGLALEDSRKCDLTLIGRQSGKELGGISDWSHRIAKFMREHCNEFVLAVVRLAQRLLHLLPFGDVAGGAGHGDHLTIGNFDLRVEEMEGRRVGKLKLAKRE